MQAPDSVFFNKATVSAWSPACAPSPDLEPALPPGKELTCAGMTSRLRRQGGRRTWHFYFRELVSSDQTNQEHNCTVWARQLCAQSHSPSPSAWSSCGASGSWKWKVAIMSRTASISLFRPWLWSSPSAPPSSCLSPCGNETHLSRALGPRHAHGAHTGPVEAAAPGGRIPAST